MKLLKMLAVIPITIGTVFVVDSMLQQSENNRSFKTELKRALDDVLDEIEVLATIFTPTKL